MTVAIVGAGIAGLAAARELKKAGVQATIFEKSRAVGGRIATRRMGPYTIDTGAQSFAPAGHDLEEVMTKELDTSDLFRITRPIYVHEGLHIQAGDARRNQTPRFTYTTGNTRLPKLMASDLEIQFNVLVERIEREGEKYAIDGTAFDFVILTMPVPQADLILWGLGERRATAPSRFRACIAVLLGFEQPPPPVAYHAIINAEGGHPLQWLSIESLKCPLRAPEGSTAMVAQLSPGFSHSAWEWPDDQLRDTVCSYLARMFGANWMRPHLSDVKKWKYSQPEMVTPFAIVNPRPARLILAGDGLAGARVEYAFDTGRLAARMVLEQI